MHSVWNVQFESPKELHQSQARQARPAKMKISSYWLRFPLFLDTFGYLPCPEVEPFQRKYIYSIKQWSKFQLATQCILCCQFHVHFCHFQKRLKLKFILRYTQAERQLTKIDFHGFHTSMESIFMDFPLMKSISIDSPSIIIDGVFACAQQPIRTQHSFTLC